MFHTVRGALDRAIPSHEQALVLRKELVAGSKDHAGLRDELASTEIALGKLLISRDPPRAAQLLEDGAALAKALHEGDPLDNMYKETYASALLGKAELARAKGDREAARAALTEALAIAQIALDRAGQSATWPGFAADLHIRLAELEPKREAALIHWFTARDLLGGLADSGRLSAERKPLLVRARAQTANLPRPAALQPGDAAAPSEGAPGAAPAPEAPAPSAPATPSWRGAPLDPPMSPPLDYSESPKQLVPSDLGPPQ